MTYATGIDAEWVQATDGDIAVINLKSALQASWNRFWRDPHRPGVAELIVEQEQLTVQYCGDLEAFDRLETLLDAIAGMQSEAGRTDLMTAQVACSTHRFADARGAVAKAAARGAPLEATERLSLTIDQATGVNLLVVLAARRERATQRGNWGEWVPLGALLADLGEVDAAEHTYLQALREYPDVSPFALAWVCFQLGMLWGECAEVPQPQRAAQWYRRAIEYLPGYVKARVHLAEIYLEQGKVNDARALLAPALESGDPEVTWRLSDVARAEGNSVEAAMRLDAARSGFDALLVKHPLAFADHGAEFYGGSGDDPRRAFELAQLNLANRPTLRAFEQAHATALAAGEARVAAQLRVDAKLTWGSIAAFRCSPLAMDSSQQTEEANART